MSKLNRDQQSVKLWSVVQAHHPGLITDRREKNIEIRLWAIAHRPSSVQNLALVNYDPI
jgi:hypothetical protein